MNYNVDTFERDTFRMKQNKLTQIQSDKLAALKGMAMNMERVLQNCLPQSLELSLCMTKLQELIFWASYKVTEPVNEN